MIEQQIKSIINSFRADEKQLPLKRFRAAIEFSGQREVIIRSVGTSIAETVRQAPGRVFAESLQKSYGNAKSVYLAATIDTAEQPVNGWLAQYYGGPKTCRLRGNSGAGATAISYELRGSKVSILYGTETDGGNMGVAINGSAQTAISCNGAQTIHNIITYTLDPTQTSLITITAPSSGFAYFEAILFENPSPYGKRGIRFDNVSFGGSGLKNMFAGTERVTGSGMATSQAISGSNGVNSVFAPSNALLKPDLIVYSGFTNDLAGSSNDTVIASYVTLLTAALTAADAAGIDVIVLLEPANGLSYPASLGGVTTAGQSSTTKDDGTTQWGKARAAVIAAVANFTDAAIVVDWDYALKQKAFADRYHSLTDLTDPHPADNGYGNPYIIGGELMLKTLGFTPPSRIEKSVGVNHATALYFSQSTEPLFAPLESIWEDTSNGTGDAAVLKRKVANLGYIGYKNIDYDTDPTLPGTKALWHIIAGNPAAASSVAVVGTTTPDSGSWGTVTTLYTGVPQASLTALGLNYGALIQNKYYTISLAVRSTDATIDYLPAILYIQCGNSYLVPETGLFDATISVPHVQYVYPKGTTAKRYAITFKWPSTAELAVLTGQGNTNSFIFKIGYSGDPLLVTDIRLDAGASCVLPSQLPISKLGTGTRDNTTVLYGDGVFRTPSAPPAVIDDYMYALGVLGSPLVAQGIGTILPECVTNVALASGVARVMAIHIPTAKTITGAAISPETVGVFTGSSDNKIGLYTYSAGVLTLVAQTADDANIWKQSLYVIYQKDFVTPYVAAPGLYFLIMMYNNSAQTTAPALKAAPLLTGPGYYPLIGSNVIWGTRSISTMPSTLNLNTVSGVGARIWCAVY